MEEAGLCRTLLGLDVQGPARSRIQVRTADWPLWLTWLGLMSMHCPRISPLQDSPAVAPSVPDIQAGGEPGIIYREALNMRSEWQ